MSNQLKKITTRANAIRRKKPGMKWTSAIKQAGADYRSGKLGSVTVTKTKTVIGKKRKAGKKTRRRVASPVSRKRVTGVVRRTTTNLGSFKEAVKQKLADAVVRYEMANTVKATKKAAADRNKYRRLLKQL